MFMKLGVKRDLNCPYSVLPSDILCEHKIARVIVPNTPTLHNHDGYEILLFLNGDVNLIVESAEKRLERGDLIVIPSFAFHGITLTDVAHYERIVLNLRPQLLKNMSDLDTDFLSILNISSQKLCFMHLNEDQISFFVDLLDKLEKSQKSTEYGHLLLSKSYLIQFLLFAFGDLAHTQASSFDNIMPPIVKKVFEIIEDNITKDITVESISRECNINRDYLGKIFKSATGGSLKHYINAKKISLAQQYISQGYSPYDVCFMVGYNNYSSFSRRFSAHVGQSPKQYQMKRGKKYEKHELH